MLLYYCADYGGVWALLRFGTQFTYAYKLFASPDIPLAATLPQRTHIFLRRLLAPAARPTLPFAAPRIFDNCIKSTSAGGQAEPCQVAQAHGLRTAIYLVVAEPSAGRLCKEGEASPVYADITRTTPCPPVNFVIVRQPAGEPSACAVPSIGRAFGPKRPNFKTNLIPKSDSRAWSGSAGGLAAGESRFGKYRKTAFVNGARAGPRLRFGAATVKRER